ncbi:MAG TPA: DUF2442 domain-containing protein [Opitutaceae bacterium]|nr:DUF2442 domain-containing protein [Opitutaceae bacterium]
MIEVIKVVEARALDDHRIWVRFSNGKQGVHDFADMLAEGGVMVEPLRDPAMFRRVFLEFGTLSWPSGFDLDSIALHERMAAAGELTPVAAE